MTHTQQSIYNALEIIGGGRHISTFKDKYHESIKEAMIWILRFMDKDEILFAWHENRKIGALFAAEEVERVLNSRCGTTCIHTSEE